MQKRIVLSLLSLFVICSCEEVTLSYSSDNLQITINTGEHWLHDFPLFLGITKENPPQFAIWIEDTSGNYISTIYVTAKMANESWISNSGNRRKEALPHWCYQRGVQYDDGLYLPTKENPFTDCITGATPKADKNLKLALNELEYPFVIKAEFNHSIDWNDNFPKNATKGDENYSGGKEGSGQPAVIYSAGIDGTSDTYELQLIGRSSADGSDGNIYNDLEKLTSAKSIVKSITVEIME